MTNIFEEASRRKLRFLTSVGLVTTEDLWDMPLTNRSGKVSLDHLARGTHAGLKARDEVSFVEERPDPEKAELELKLDILKHVIAVKLKERKSAEEAAANADRKQKIMAAIAKKQEGALEQMSEADLKAELSKL